MEDQLPIPDRWRLIEGLGVVRERWFDPYHQNTLKGDRPIDRAKVPWLPIRGDDWFFVLNAVSDTVFEPRTFPITNGVQTTARPGSLDVFGKTRSFVASQTVIGGVALKLGSAPCGERVGTYVQFTVVAVSVKKNHGQRTTHKHAS